MKKIEINWDDLADALLKASQCQNIYSRDVRDIFSGIAISIDYATNRLNRENSKKKP